MPLPALHAYWEGKGRGGGKGGGARGREVRKMGQEEGVVCRRILCDSCKTKKSDFSCLSVNARAPLLFSTNTQEERIYYQVSLPGEGVLPPTNLFFSKVGECNTIVGLGYCFHSRNGR